MTHPRLTCDAPITAVLFLITAPFASAQGIPEAPHPATLTGVSGRVTQQGAAGVPVVGARVTLFKFDLSVFREAPMRPQPTTPTLLMSNAISVSVVGRPLRSPRAARHRLNRSTSSCHGLRHGNGA